MFFYLFYFKRMGRKSFLAWASGPWYYFVVSTPFGMWSILCVTFSQRYQTTEYLY